MTTYYVDYVGGNNAWDGTAPAYVTGTTGPKQTFWAMWLAIAAGNNSILLKRGQTHVLANGHYIKPKAGTSDGARFLIGTYGTGDRPLITKTNGAGANEDMGSIQAGESNITIEDLVFDAQADSTINSVFRVRIGTAADIKNVTIRRCDFRNSYQGNGLTFPYSSETYHAQVVENIQVIDCVASGNGEHGFYYAQNGATLFLRCDSYNNGLRDGGHGFSSQSRPVAVSSGWTSVSGTIYKRSVTPTVTSVRRVDAPIMLLENVATPTTPASGEFGYSSGELYINIGKDPAGVSITYGTSKGQPIYVFCNSYNNRSYGPYAVDEGAGFQFDDATYYGRAIGCKSYNNDGVGYGGNGVVNPVWIGCVAYGNGKQGLYIGARAPQVINMTSCDNGVPRYDTDGALMVPAAGLEAELAFGNCSSVEVYNAAIRSGIASGSVLTHAIYMEATGAATATVNTVAAQNATGFYKSATANTSTNIAVGTPEIDSDYKPSSLTSNLVGAGIHTGYKNDAAGHAFYNPPSIGAYEAPRARSALTQARAARV